MARFVFIVLLFCSSLTRLNAQGSWVPGNADLGFPRTLLRANEIPAVQARIAQAPFFSLYDYLWDNSYNWPVPTVFTADAVRRRCAFTSKDIAFLLLLNRKTVGSTLDTLTTPERDSLIRKVRYLMENMNTNVETFPNYDPYLWRSNEITNFLCAYDMLKGAGVHDSILALSRSRLHTYVTNLQRESSASFFGVSFYSNYVNNHGLRTAAALALASIVLNDAVSNDVNGQPVTWMNTGFWNIDNILWRSGSRQSDSGFVAGYAEGPHYLRFGVKHMLVAFHALNHFIPDTTLAVQFGVSPRTIRHPWHDNKYNLLWEWVMLITQPDGIMPPLEDSFADIGFPELALTDKPQYLANMFYSNMHPAQANNLFQQLFSSTDDMIPDYIASLTDPAPLQPPLFSPSVTSGDLVFRSGYDSASIYLHANGRNGMLRTNAKGHNQGDATSFLIHAYGHPLALDPGYLKYDRRGEVGHAWNHNMVLINGAGPPIGSVANGNDADAFIEDAFELSTMSSAEVRSSYGGGTVKRNFNFIRNRYFILYDLAECANAQPLEWRLQGNGLQGGTAQTGTFISDETHDRATWYKGNARLTTVIKTVPQRDNFNYITQVHELAYDSTSQHTSLGVPIASTLKGQYLAVMYPWENDSLQPDTVSGMENVLVYSGGGFADLMSVASAAGLQTVSASQTVLNQDLTWNSDFLIYSADTSGVFSFLRTETGDLCVAGGDTVFLADAKADIGWQKRDASNWDGFFGKASGNVTTAVELAVDFEPVSVVGQTVVGWTYSQVTGRVRIEFSGDGIFLVTLDTILASGEQSLPDGSWVAWPVPAPEFVKVASRDVNHRESVVTLMDLQGHVLGLRRVEGRGECRFDLAGLPAGVYLLRVESAGKRSQLLRFWHQLP